MASPSIGPQVAPPTTALRPQFSTRETRDESRRAATSSSTYRFRPARPALILRESVPRRPELLGTVATGAPF